MTRQSSSNKNINRLRYLVNINFAETAMLSILDKLFDKLPQLIITLETSRFGAMIFVVLIVCAVVSFGLYVVRGRVSRQR